MNVPCPTHSGRRAHKSCHFCRKAICRLCEVRMRGHLYCSEKCARDAGRHAAWRRVRDVLAARVPARAAVAAVLLATAAPVTLALRTVRELDGLNVSSPLARPRRDAPTARLDAIVATPTGLRLTGSSSSGAAVFLFSGSRFVGAAPVEDGHFQFDGVREKGPFRVGAMPLSSALAYAPPRPAPAPSPVAVVGLPATPLSRATPPALRRPTTPPVLAAAPPPVPAPQGGVPPDLTRGPGDRRDILVSFDGGSSDRGASAILDALAARGIRTTIFLTGEFIRRYPDIARRIAADGHEVGNHTDTHPHLTTYASDSRQVTRLGVDRAFLAGELARTARLYREATGRTMAPLWRAPFGEHNAEIRRWAAEQGYWHVGWTGGRSGLDGLDWVSDPRSRAYQPADRLLARLVAHAENGGIVLLHLGSDREEPVASRIGFLFDGLKARGFRFARATEFLSREGFDEAKLAAFRIPSASGVTQ
ncbi:MAG TPA: polysaccharide deacetylase family protein [Thermoanaerobaculia bacterium]|nr:polysaccharide deacetylase family protein [Thermoanaerobaculia bacterium]